MRREEEEAGEEVEEEDSCTLAVWEGRVDWQRRQPPWQETPIQYSSPEATVETFFSKEKVTKQSLSDKEIVQRKLRRKEGEMATKKKLNSRNKI